MLEMGTIVLILVRVRIVYSCLRIGRITEVYFSHILDRILHLIFPNLCYHNSVSAFFVLCVGTKILKSKIRVKHT